MCIRVYVYVSFLVKVQIRRDTTNAWYNLKINTHTRLHALAKPRMAIVHAKVQGTVQQVMFRQTVIRAMISRNIVGGATNLEQKDQVELTLEGDENHIKDLLQALKTTKPLNSWGAQVNTLTVLNLGKAINEHQV
jgi:acylphosphatase